MIYDPLIIITCLYAGPPLAPSLNDTGSDLCFESYSYYAIDYFLVEIMDISGDKWFQTEPSVLQHQKSCITVTEEYFPSSCFPFDVSVKAHNKVGNSTATNTTLHLQGKLVLIKLTNIR